MVFSKAPGSFACLIGSRLVSDIRHPCILDVDLEFMHSRLGEMRRFAGHPRAMTVREHLGLCELLAIEAGMSESRVRWASRHDLHEYALGDTLGPLKAAIGSPLLKIEKRWDEAIYGALGSDPLPTYRDRAAVVAIDWLALYLEWRFCLGRLDGFEWFSGSKLPKPEHLDALRAVVGADRIVGWDWECQQVWP